MGAVLVAVGGRVASGKSTLARELARRLSAVHLDADSVRDDLLAVAEEEGGGHASAERWAEALSASMEDEVYLAMLQRAGDLLEEGTSVVVAGCFPRAAQRREARALSRLRAVPFLFVECRVSEEEHRRRLAERERRDGRGGWEEIAGDLAARVEEGGLPPEATLAVSTGEPVAVLAERVVRALREGPDAVRREAEPADAARSGRPGTGGGARMPAAPRALEPPAAVTFDCWNTLIYEANWEVAIALRVDAVIDAAREAGREATREEAARAFDAAWERHMRIWQGGAQSGAREIALWALAELGLLEPHPAFEHLVKRFEEASHTSRVRALDGARETLAALTARGVPCALVCDTGLTPGRIVRLHLEQLGLLEHLSALAFSDEVGVPKPHPRAFRAALEPLGVAWERTWHVGDLLRTDVAGARALGMGAVRIRARHDDASGLPEADLVVASHAELQRALTSP